MPSILHRTTKRVLRPTRVPPDERLKAPLIRSPSCQPQAIAEQSPRGQRPGTDRASMSLGRLIICNVSKTMALPASVVRLSARRLCLPQRPDHRSLQLAAWLRVNCSIYGVMPHAGDRIIRLHDPQSRRNLLGRPVQMHALAMGKAIKIASFDKLALAATRAAGSIDKACHMRTIGAVFPPTLRQIVRAGRCKSCLIDLWLLPRLCLANITPRSSLIGCLLRLSIATSYAERALWVALETLT